MIAAYRTFGSISITGRIDEELVHALPRSWRYLAHNGESVVSLIKKFFGSIRGGGLCARLMSDYSVTAIYSASSWLYSNLHECRSWL